MVHHHAVRQRAAARDALAARTRRLTGGALAISALLSGAFAGLVAASAPGKKLNTAAPAPTPTSVTTSKRKPARTTVVRTAIPPLPAPPGPGNLSAPPPTPAPTPTPSPASAPVTTPAQPVVVSGGS